EVGGPTGAMTVWAGLLFLFATAEAAGLPEPLLEDPRLGARSVRWVMHRLARLLVPIGGRDPAALAFAGLPPDAEPPAGVATSPSEETALTEGAERWAEVTAQRLGKTNADPSGVVTEVARRRGEIVAERGW